jgi:hypothetical protein
MAVKDRCVAGANLTWVVEDDDLSIERVGAFGWIILGISGDIASTDFLDRDILDVEANIVTWNPFGELFVMHLDRLDFGGDIGGGEGDDHARLDDTSLDTADRNSANTGDFVHILKWKAEWLVSRSAGRIDGVDSLKKSLASNLGVLGVLGVLSLLRPALIPWSVGGDIDHVVTVEARDRDDWISFFLVPDLPNEAGNRLADFFESSLPPLGAVLLESGVHLVDGNDDLSDAKGKSKEGVLASLPILGNTSFEFTSSRSNDENGAIGLRGTSDHVLDKVTVTWCVNDGDEVFWSLKLPKGDIDGDTTLTFGLQFVKDPSIFEGALAQLSSFLKPELVISKVSLQSKNVS